MRILFFSNSPANAEEYLKITNRSGGWLKFLDRYLQEEVDLHIVFQSKESIQGFRYLNTKYYPVVTQKRPILNFFFQNNREVTVSEVKEYLNIIETVSPDIIHIAGSENTYGLIVDHIKDIPIVLSVQGILTVITHKFFSGIEPIYLKQFGYMDRYNPWSYRYLFNKFKKMSSLERQVLQQIKFIIGRTDWDRRVTRILAPNSKYFHNDEILREGFYHSTWQNKLTVPLKLVTTTGPSLYKGLETILESANLLLKQGVKFEWKIIGLKSTDRLVKIIKKKVDLNKNIVFLGVQTEQEIINHLLNAHIYVMASHIENSPNNLCEAMLLGIPIVATNAGGTSSLFKDERDGVLIQDGDPWSLAGAILETVEDYNTAIKRGKNARQKALERHNPTKLIYDLLNIYREINNNV